MNKNVKLLISGSFISTFGDYMYHIAISLLAYNQTNSIMSVAYMWLVRALFRIPSQILAGHLTDNYNRKNIILLSNLLSFFTCFLFILEKNNMILMLLTIGILQALNDFDINSSQAILPELVEREEVKKINMIFTKNNSLSALISPAITGMLYSVLGIEIIFIINAITFLISALLFSKIEYEGCTKQKNEKEKLKTAIKIGVCKIKENIEIKGAIKIMLIINGLIRLFYIYKLPIIDEFYALGKVGIIYFNYIDAVVGIVFAKVVKDKLEKIDFGKSTSILVLTMILFAWGSNWIYGVFVYALFCLFGIINNVEFKTIIQMNSDNEYIGRIFSSFRIMVIIITIPTTLIANYLAKLSIKYTILVYGIISIGFIFKEMKNKLSRKEKSIEYV